ncbi:MAG: molybdopterin-dependent oxidoreductase [Chloroflexota bacterium]|nr:molybdopterin-dependent oxidoreductase [Chloroflexota bacterium]
MQNTYRWMSLLILSALLIGLVGCGGGAPKVDWEIKISGAVDNPLTVSYADLVKRPQVKLEDILMQRSQGEDTVDTWEGPALWPILEEAGISPNATAITATAADGYAIQIALSDMPKERTIIALKYNGEWSADDKEHGPVRIVVGGLPANHWIFQLTEIEVEE